MSDTFVGHAITGGSERPSRSFTRGRVCHEDGCKTVLSMYNDGKFCALHQPMEVPRTRGKKIA